MNKKSSNNEKILNAFNNDLNDLVFFTFRYFLGRMSAGVSGFTESLIASWPNLNDKTKKQIKKELEKAIEEDNEMRNDPTYSSRYYPLGMDCDRDCWINVMQAILADEINQDNLTQLKEDKEEDSKERAVGVQSLAGNNI